MADNVEARLKALEEEVADLKRIVTGTKPKTGWKKMVGAFLDDPLFEQAIKYGREYRESQRPIESKTSETYSYSKQEKSPAG